MPDLTNEQITEGRRRLSAVKDGYRGSDITSWDAWAFNHAEALLDAAAENAKLRTAYYKVESEVCQTLGKVLGYPWFKDDQKNFSGATEADGVCVGEHVAESIATEAADVITRLQSKCIRECPF